ncbi:uncharacterized protein METZ01_LOCUS10458 [marine metagenome]|uniref:ACT domain-containing protein n=1 Tax=marine metagenome TaxID=408172 RepID=A0A381NU01_9ZZZZ
MSSNLILSNQEIRKASIQSKKNSDQEFLNWLKKRKSGVSGIENFLRNRSNTIDNLISSIWVTSNLSERENICLFAVGGYGRQELHPYSDIDLLILYKGKLNKNTRTAIESFISQLWDLDLDLGHSVRSTYEEEKIVTSDLEAFTNLLESRFLFGDQRLESVTKAIIERKNIWKKEKFLLNKIEEQEQRHKKYDNTEYNLEPNIKSSPGGLRDIHILNWLLLNYSRKNHRLRNLEKILSKAEIKELNKSKLWLWTLRYLLHKEAGREEDRLLLNYQLSIANQLFPKIKNSNSAAEKLMHRYFRSALNISEINTTTVQRFKENLVKPSKSKIVLKDKNFKVKNNLIELKNLNAFKKNPSLMLEVFVKLCENPKITGIHSDTLMKLKESRDLIDSSFRKKKKNNDLFMKLLRSKRLMVTQLEQMKQLGILGRYLPEFGRVTGQMQYDLFHIYTVDAHTLQVLRNMRRLLLGTSKDTYPFASALTQKLPKLEILYIAGLYHDIGKGRGKDHSGLGMKIVKRFCERHRLSKKDTDLIQWLVKNHLKMSITSQKEDLSNPKTINNFTEIIGNEERLNYLYCLTVADISATNPNLWNSWNESLLNDLYFKTLNTINLKQESFKFSKSEAEKQFSSKTKSDQLKVRELWKNFYPSYFQSHPPELIKDHSLVITKRKSDTAVKFFPKNETFNTDSLLVYTKDRLNVFRTIVGELDSQNINVLEASLYGTKNGYCLDHIIISDHKGDPLQLNKDQVRDMELRITSSLEKDKLKPKLVKKKLPRHFLTLKKDTQIDINHDMVNRWTQLDIKTADRPGLLSSICSVFAKNNASIKKARISTYGERAEDRFCIASLEETPFLKKSELDKLISELKTSLDG